MKYKWITDAKEFPVTATTLSVKLCHRIDTTKALQTKLNLTSQSIGLGYLKVEYFFVYTLLRAGVALLNLINAYSLLFSTVTSTYFSCTWPNYLSLFSQLILVISVQTVPFGAFSFPMSGPIKYCWRYNCSIAFFFQFLYHRWLFVIFICCGILFR